MKPGNFFVFLVYSFFALIVLAGFVPHKYIFSFDIVPIINNSPLDLFYGMYIPIYGGNLPLSLISTIIPAALFQYTLLFIILSLAGYSMHILAGDFTDSRIGRFYAGFLYAFNPYIYSRLITGQWLLSYVILPLLIKSFIDLLDKKKDKKKNEIKEMIKFIFFLTIAGFNIHILIISFVIIAIIFLFWSNRYRKIETLKIILLSLFLFILLNSYWIIPLLNAQNTMVNNIGEKDFKAFAPKGGLFDIAAMYGFWNEGYLYTKDFLPGWQILFLIILFLSITGFIFYYDEEKIRIYLWGFTVIGIAGLILASGINGPFGDIIRWLFDNTFLKGFRDSHKFVSMIVLAYSVLGGLGLSRIERAYQNKYADDTKSLPKFLLLAVIAISLITPFAYSFTFFNGFAGQIKPTEYPADWHETNNYLNEDKQDFNILFLPWHLYMDFGWINNTNKRIVNPARYFFDKNVISGTNAEIGELFRDVNTPEQIYMDSLLDKRENITDFGKSISILNAKYIILAKESDYRKYFFIFNQTDLKLLRETDTLYVLENINYAGKMYQTDDINDLNAEKTGLDYKKINPVRYGLKENISKKYIVFTEPYSQNWRSDGRQPIMAYGVVNAFENSGKEIRFESFYKINLTAYIISILTFTGLMAGLKSKN